MESKGGSERQETYAYRDRVTGTKVAYYFVCKRKLWLFSHNITFEHENEDVKMGKLINKESYAARKKDITLDQNISLDFVRNDGTLVVHEIKKSSKMEESHRWQLLYYLFYLKQRGVEAIGKLNYPSENKNVEIRLNNVTEDRLREIILHIEHVNASEIPEVIEAPICRKCAYFEFCFGDEL